MSAIGEEKSIHITDGTSVIHVGSGLSMFDCCNYEEADTRLIVHQLHALNAGSEVILIRTGDTDVISILCGQVERISKPQHVWISFGSGKNEIQLNLGGNMYFSSAKEVFGNAIFSCPHGMRHHICFSELGQTLIHVDMDEE
jgi:hypothetical protein